MEESVTYQAIVAKGRELGRVEGAVEEARRILLGLGEELFMVAADDRVRTALETIEDRERLEQLTRRILHVTSWEELLELPQPERPRRRKRNP